MRILSACFDLPENMAITAVHPTALTLTIDLACSDPTACCPLCHQFSERVHSKYQRTVADVPCGGRRVLLLHRRAGLNMRRHSQTLPSSSLPRTKQSGCSSVIIPIWTRLSKQNLQPSAKRVSRPIPCMN
jgi:hypothetical protein